MPRGMLSCQLCMGSPKIRKGTPRTRRWAAMERPYGPAPTMAAGTSELYTMTLLVYDAHPLQGTMPKSSARIRHLLHSPQDQRIGQVPVARGHSQETRRVRQWQAACAAQPVIDARQPPAFRPGITQQLAHQRRLAPGYIVMALLHVRAVRIPGERLREEGDGPAVDGQIMARRAASSPGFREHARKIAMPRQYQMPEL